MKISDLNTSTVSNYLRLEPEEFKREDIEMVMASAMAMIQSYTGLEKEQMDTHEDITMAFLVLCQDMYDCRSFYSEYRNKNLVVETILNLHCVNLL